jgi:hypothetical protein
MKQIDWIVELERGVLEEKQKLKSVPWWQKAPKSGPLQVVDFDCDHCTRKIIIQFKYIGKEHREAMHCICGREYIMGAKVTEKWIKDVSIKE